MELLLWGLDEFKVSSRRYRKLVDGLRAFLKNEIGRVMNKALNRFYA